MYKPSQNTPSVNMQGSALILWETCGLSSDKQRTNNRITTVLSPMARGPKIAQWIITRSSAHISDAVIRQFCTHKLSFLTDRIAYLYSLSTRPITRDYYTKPNKFTFNKSSGEIA